MDVVLDARLVGWSGIGRYVEELVNQFAKLSYEDQVRLLISAHLPEPLTAASKFEKVLVSSRPLSLREQIEIPFAMRRERPGVVHIPHFNVPVMLERPLVVTLHDLIPFAIPQSMPSAANRLVYRSLNKMAVKKARVILTPSEKTRQDLVEYLNAAADRIVVTPSGVSDDFRKLEDAHEFDYLVSHLGIRRPFIFAMGNQKPHKNIGRLVEAFALAKKDLGDCQLVLAGKKDSRFPQVSELVEELKVQDSVVFTDFLTVPGLVTLYNMASVFAFPSLYEGFGLPPLEAMACGVPVICSNRSPMKEIVDEAALLFEPTSIEEIADCLKKAFAKEELRQSLIAKGYERAKSFSWLDTAKKTLEVYKSVSE